VALRLYPPGTRKGNQFILARGRVGGRDIEISTGTTDPIAAERIAAELTLRILEQSHLLADPTFNFAADAWIAFRKPSAHDVNRLSRLRSMVGPSRLSQLTVNDFVKAANDLYPHSTNATKNRAVVTLARCVMHYAADNKWCEYLKLKGFKEPKPVTRALDEETARALIAAADADLRPLLLVLFKQGFRITDALGITWEDCIKLDRRVFRICINKSNKEWKEFPIDDEVYAMLRAWPEALRTGYLFRWRTKSGVYRTLYKMLPSVGVHFTPHMARHSLGTWLNAQGEGLRTIMETLGHVDPKSSIRYQSGDVKLVRAAQQRLGKTLGKLGSSN
jgi:integrase